MTDINKKGCSIYPIFENFVTPPPQKKKEENPDTVFGMLYFQHLICRFTSDDFYLTLFYILLCV